MRFLKAMAVKGEQAFEVRIGAVTVLFHHGKAVAYTFGEGRVDRGETWCLTYRDSNGRIGTTTRQLQTRAGYYDKECNNTTESEAVFERGLLDALGKDLPRWGELLALDEADNMGRLHERKKQAEAEERAKNANIPDAVIAACDKDTKNPLKAVIARLLKEKPHLPPTEFCEWGWEKVFAKDGKTTFLQFKVAYQLVRIVIHQERKRAGLVTA